MNHRPNPWTATATASRDPFAPQPQPETEVDYGELYEAHLAEVRAREASRSLVLHSTDCRDAGPWPVRRVDCEACAAKRL